MLLRFVAIGTAALVLAGCAQQDNTGTAGSSAAGQAAQNASAAFGGADATNAGETSVSAAVCVLQSVGDSGVSGTVHFHQRGDQVKVTGEVTGLEPGLHGFHVHELGDLTSPQDGKSTGGHYAPRGMKHGKPEDAERHVGDLGNVEAGDSGTAVVDMTDSVISLNGPHSIVGRAIVVHAGEDKFTQPTGDAGARVAFGVIGIAKP